MAKTEVKSREQELQDAWIKYFKNVQKENYSFNNQVLQFDIKEDEMLGKIVEIKHNNELVSSYTGLSIVNVQKGENITKGMKIGVSGTNKVNESLGNHLHFEIYQNGVNIDPLKVLGKKIGDF